MKCHIVVTSGADELLLIAESPDEAAYLKLWHKCPLSAKWNEPQPRNTPDGSLTLSCEI